MRNIIQPIRLHAFLLDHFYLAIYFRVNLRAYIIIEKVIDEECSAYFVIVCLINNNLLFTLVGILHIKELQRSPLVQRSFSDPTLCGMCCLVSSPKEGFMYDVFSNCKLLSYYKYTCDTISVSACNNLLHAITKQGIETYTVRMYAAASDWIRTNAPVDQKVNQQSMVKDQTKADQAKGLLSEPCAPETKSKNVAQISNARHLESRECTTPDAISVKSSDSGDQVGNIQRDSPASVMEDLPSTSSSSVSEALTVDSDVMKEKPLESDLMLESPFGSEQDESSPSDVTLTVDQAGRTLVKFSTGSPVDSPTLVRKGTPLKDDKDDSSKSRLAAMSSVGRSIPPYVKLSEAAYLAAVNKLSSDPGWTLPIFDLQILRQVSIFVLIKLFGRELLLGS